MTDTFSLGHVPVNTLVALGTKTKTAGHRSLSDGCIWMKTGVSIENGRAIGILLHRPASAAATAPLSDGDVVNIFNVCGELSAAHALCLEPADGSLTWLETPTLPRAATWLVCATPWGPAVAASPLEIMQTVFLVHISSGSVVSTRRGSGSMRFVGAPIGSEGSGDMLPVPFYFTTPHFIPAHKVPPFILAWFPAFRAEANTQWLNNWNQTTPMHVSQRSKWNADILTRLALEKGAAGLLTASESAKTFKPWTAAQAVATAPRHSGVLANTLPWSRVPK